MSEQLIQEVLSPETRVISQSNLFKSIQQGGFACAFYRLPQHTNSNIIIDINGARNLEKLTVEDGEEGFVFHPFSNKSHDIKFLRKDIHFVSDTTNETMKLINRYCRKPNYGKVCIGRMRKKSAITIIGKQKI